MTTSSEKSRAFDIHGIDGCGKTHGSPRTGWQVVRPELAPLPSPLRLPLPVLHFASLLFSAVLPSPTFTPSLLLVVVFVVAAAAAAAATAAAAAAAAVVVVAVVVVRRARAPTFWQAYKNKTGTLSGPLQWLLSICSLHPPRPLGYLCPTVARFR